MAIKDVLKAHRDKARLKQEDVAELLGVSKQTYSKWENGRTEPKASQVNKLSEILKVSAEEICSGELIKNYDVQDFIGKLSSIRNKMNTWSFEIALVDEIKNHDKFFRRLEKVVKAEYEQ